MIPRLSFWVRIGVFAAIMGSTATVAAAQGERRLGNDIISEQRQRCQIPGCGRGGEAVRRHYDRPVWRGRGDNRPPRYRDDYRPSFPTYRPYRPRYYDGYGGSDIYLDFYTPSYRSYDPVPVYPRRYYRRDVVMSAAHVDWCYKRYRTYRESDNTYVPRRGVRAQCISPYS